MSEEVVFRRGTLGDVSAIVPLLARGLGPGRSPRTAEFFRWKHFRNPFGASPMLLGEAKGRVVVLRAFLRWRFRLGEARIEAVRAVDTVTDPDFRGRGFFRRSTLQLLEELQPSVRLVFNTPNAKSGAGYLKMGWQPWGRVDLFAAPLRARSRAPRAWHTFDASLPTTTDAERLAAATTPRTRLRTELNDHLLRWRFGETPELGYRVAEDEGVRLVFMRRTRRGREELSFLEVLVGSRMGDARRARALLRDVAEKSGAHYALAAAPHVRVAAVLLSAGFVPAPRTGPRFVVRRPPNAPALDPSPVLRRSWALSIGDIELM